MGWWSERRARKARAAARAALEGADPRALRYVERPFALDPRSPAERTRFVVLDSEATGLDLAADRLLTVAAVAVVDGAVRVADHVELTIDRPTVGAAPIHGLLPRDLAGGTSEAEAMLGLLDHLEDAVLVAHHVAFDGGMIEAALRRIHPALRLWNPRLDTAALARRLELGPLPVQPSRGASFALDALCDRYGVPLSGRHTAAGDALATACLLLVLLARARRQGIVTVGDLLR